jgi:hypothetical protein
MYDSRAPGQRARISGCLAVVCGVALLSSGEARAAAPLRVRATTRLADAGVVSGPGYEEVRGRLLDDLDQPIAGSAVELTLPDRIGATGSACPGSPGPEPSGSTWRLTTDDGGNFCLRFPSLPQGAQATLRFGGTPYFAPLEAEFPTRPARYSVRLTFDSPVIEVVLDRPIVTLWVTASSSAGGAFGSNLRLTVRHVPPGGGVGTDLPAQEVTVGARARIDLATAMLGAPGPGALVFSFSGTPAIAPFEARVAIRRVAAVALSLAGPLERPDTTAILQARVGVASGGGAVSGGWVEVLVAGRTATVSPVRSGVAALDIPLEGSIHSPHEVLARYVPEEPWWLAGDPLTIQVPALSARPLRTLPWLATVLAIAYWVIRAWQRPVRRARTPTRGPAPRGFADVELLEEGAPASGWVGRVVDAHDGSPVADARVEIVLPRFDGEGIGAAATTDRTGAFALHPRDTDLRAAQVRVTSAHHGTLARRLPRPGRLVISVTSRRRLLLERLVTWANRLGRPWAAGADPTPAEISATASRIGRADVARWAHGVEEAAYGMPPPDEARERALAEREPRFGAPPDER